MKILFMLPAAKGIYADEAENRRISVIQSYATPTIQIDIVNMPGVSGFSPWGQKQPDSYKSAGIIRAHELGAECALQAESDGYDAFCPFGLIDIGVQEARRRGVGIPVIGAAESSALICGMLGRRFARCFYLKSEEIEDQARDRVIPWGLQDLFVGTTAIGIPNSEYPHRRKEVLSRFVSCANEAREMGAEVMGMIGMSICPIEFSSKELSQACGMPVIDGIAAQMSMAEFWNVSGLPGSLMKIPR
ncbi:MAG TPA: hypothetical protein VMU99_02510 [Acidimicrobiales bacterium]|nr:hypothetical protein [Acidimicrobiales bacterium]